MAAAAMLLTVDEGYIASLVVAVWFCTESMSTIVCLILLSLQCSSGAKQASWTCILLTGSCVSPACSFKHYTELVEDKVMPKYDAVWHWAKIELPDQPERLAAMRTRLAARYPLTQFNTWRGKLDPNNILSNKVIDELLGQPIVS